jgi:hypothetical protein
MHRKTAAILQGAILACLLALVVGALLFAHRRPFDADTLEIQAQSLQSQAAEFEATEQLARQGVVSWRWTAHHLEQLQEHVRQSRKTLASKSASPHLASALARLQATAARLDDRLTHARHHLPLASP